MTESLSKEILTEVLEVKELVKGHLTNSEKPYVQVDAIFNRQIELLASITKNLSVLPAILEETKTNTGAIRDQSASLIQAASGKNQVSNETFMGIVKWLILPILGGLIMTIIMLIGGNTFFTNRTSNIKSNQLGEVGFSGTGTFTNDAGKK